MKILTGIIMPRQHAGGRMSPPVAERDAIERISLAGSVIQVEYDHVQEQRLKVRPPGWFSFFST